MARLPSEIAALRHEKERGTEPSAQKVGESIEHCPVIAFLTLGLHAWQERVARYLAHQLDGGILGRALDWQMRKTSAFC